MKGMKDVFWGGKGGGFLRRHFPMLRLCSRIIGRAETSHDLSAMEYQARVEIKHNVVVDTWKKSPLWVYMDFVEKPLLLASSRHS